MTSTPTLLLELCSEEGGIIATSHGREGCYKVRYQVFNMVRMRGEIVKMEHIEFHTEVLKWNEESENKFSFYQ